MASVFNLYIDQGADFSQEFSVIGDLTDVVVTSKMRKHPEANTAYTFTCSANAEAGTILLTMDHVTTANIAAGKYVYDVEVYYNASNTVYRAIEGLVVVSPNVTY